MSIERRFVKGAQVRAAGDEAKPVLEGYAAVFNQEYVLYEDTGMRWVETIKAGAFARVLRERQDVRCLFNHDPNQVLARTENNTLQMREDSKGLTYDAALDARTHVAQDVRCFVDRRDVTGCSFSFQVSKQAWREEETPDGKMTTYTREIEEIGSLYDVGPVTFPAYEGTSVGARSLAQQLHRVTGVAPELRSRMLARALKRDDDEEMACSCRCDACSRCENKRSARGMSGAEGGCECECRACKDGNCAGCPDDLQACGDETNCACERSAPLSLEYAQAKANALRSQLD